MRRRATGKGGCTMRAFYWVADVQYPGKPLCWFGHVVATNVEHARVELEKEWSLISPHPMPYIVAIHRGRILIELDESDRPEPA
jgi:hypothetical protein